MKLQVLENKSSLLLAVVLVIWFTSAATLAQKPDAAGKDTKADAIVSNAIRAMGGDRYLQAKTQIGRGKFSVIRKNAVASFQSFVDVVVFPDKERTEFKGNGSRTIQTNTGDTGWVFDGDQKLIKVQAENQIANFKLGLRTSIDYLLKGAWRADGVLSYIGKRAATLGKRNDVVKLTYKDGFTAEFEFASDDGLPQKVMYSRSVADGEVVKEEDRYAQFVDINGIKAPFIVDRYTNGTPTSRINYESVEFDRSIPDSVFTKPAGPKDIKDPKF